jgi:drug/metabolite transporter (DMT)-like permease
MWQWYALTAMTCFAVMQLLFVQLTRKGTRPSALLFVVFGVASLCYAVYVRATRTPLPHDPAAVALLALAGLLSFTGNLCSLRAMSLAPNPGYASAISGVHALVVTLAAIAVLGAAVSWMKLAGVVLCVLGVALLVA